MALLQSFRLLLVDRFEDRVEMLFCCEASSLDFESADCCCELDVVVVDDADSDELAVPFR